MVIHVIHDDDKLTVINRQYNVPKYNSHNPLSLSCHISYHHLCLVDLLDNQTVQGPCKAHYLTLDRPQHSIYPAVSDRQ
jgi:hypothetical protein